MRDSKKTWAVVEAQLVERSLPTPEVRGSNPDIQLKMGHPGLFFRLFKQTIQFLQQIYVKNVNPAYSAGICSHDLQNMSLLP